MHVVENKSSSKKKIYRSTLLRESYRENGKVKKRTIANISHCTPGEIAAIKLALKHKDDLSELGSLKESVALQEGLSVGAVWAVYQTAKKLGIEKALGTSFAGKLALWQVIARVIDQGSRLSAVRLAQSHAACDVLTLLRGFDENNLYENLEWLSKNQDEIEKALFVSRRGKALPQLFLYDVTSSYLEGEKNFFGDYGYGRDGKKGKKQIVIGLLCDEYGDAVSTEVFHGNTQDPKTFLSQVEKAGELFGCKSVTFVGDRGMIKKAQVDNLPEHFHYITAITKPQIRSLIKTGVIQMELFDKEVCEVEEDGIRYVLRRNPIRADEMAQTRLSKLHCIENFLQNKNEYLSEHPKARVTTAQKEVEKKIRRLKLDKWLSVHSKEQGRELFLGQDDKVLKEMSLLDGCYVIKTDLSAEELDTEGVHDRYKDLTEVERAFRDCKTVHLEVRPIHVRLESSTRGHVLVVMLSYMIIRHLRRAWEKFDMTVPEGIAQLSTLCSVEMKVKDQGACIKIPRPRENTQKLFKALKITLPIVLPHRKMRVVTRKKLTKQRINNLK
ncbi:MAG: IS1634 family transposase [Candidatus Scalindua sp. AMX11]|nr:IS1634 family transposase [Planctomycetota bacterium]RZV60328.1 MAG: IS1634 family transposase [Candidatus Scalindua sp. SCAELEC01]TDE63088.1 MAG: IS1634 family transposase [Candidatus Scalindua sp. AMX11]NOG83889.1 IS1634 family transposase [Planctomycetota bacterium]NOG84244.1 IS1634 family transposase [Planctomycetota bacterium]